MRLAYVACLAACTLGSVVSSPSPGMAREISRTQVCEGMRHDAVVARQKGEFHKQRRILRQVRRTCH